MRTNNLSKKVGQFFKDKDGKWTLFQFPNTLLLIWIVLTILLWAIGHSQFVNILKLIQTVVFIAWALLEVIDGDSYFRRTLGVVILVMITFSIFL